MRPFETINTNVMIAMLRGLTHELDRVNARLDDPDLPDEVMEELGLYYSDLESGLSSLMEEYETRRNLPEYVGRLTEIKLLLDYFSKEDII